MSLAEVTVLRDACIDHMSVRGLAIINELHGPTQRKDLIIKKDNHRNARPEVLCRRSYATRYKKPIEISKELLL